MRPGELGANVACLTPTAQASDWQRAQAPALRDTAGETMADGVVVDGAARRSTSAMTGEAKRSAAYLSSSLGSWGHDRDGRPPGHQRATTSGAGTVHRWSWSRSPGAEGACASTSPTITVPVVFVVPWALGAAWLVSGAGAVSRVADAPRC